jgi:hypothetical protein
MDLEEVIARLEITDVLHRYCRAVDRRDPDLLRSAYHPDATDDHGVYAGPVEGLVEFMLGDGLEMIHHAISNIVIERDGDVARVECYLDAVHRRVDDTGSWDELLKARYLDRFERRDGEWRVAHRIVVLERAYTTVAIGGKRAGTATTWGRRDGADPSYTQRSEVFASVAAAAQP